MTNSVTTLDNTLQDFTKLYNNFYKTRQTIQLLHKLYQTIHNYTQLYNIVQPFTQLLPNGTILYKSFSKLYTTLHNSTQLHKALQQKKVCQSCQHFSRLYTPLVHNFYNTNYTTQKLYNAVQHCTHLDTSLHNFLDFVQNSTHSTQFYQKINLCTSVQILQNSTKLYANIQMSTQRQISTPPYYTTHNFTQLLTTTIHH